MALHFLRAVFWTFVGQTTALRDGDFRTYPFASVMRDRISLRGRAKRILRPLGFISSRIVGNVVIDLFRVLGRSVDIRRCVMFFLE